MKLYVKREWTFSFQEAVLEIKSPREWTFLSLGLENQLEDKRKYLEHDRTCYEKETDIKEKESLKKSIEERESDIELLENCIAALKVKNEIAMDKYTIKKQKVDYVLDIDISTMAKEKMLSFLQSKYPEKRLYILPHDFNKAVTKYFVVKGHNGNLVVGFK